MTEDKIDDLIRQLASRDPKVWGSALDTLVKIGKPAVPAIIEALKDEDSDVRLGAVYTLGRIKDTRAVPAIIDTLKDENESVQWRAHESLGKIILSLTEIRLKEMEKLLIKALEKAEVREKYDLLNLLDKINEMRNEILEPDVKKLKPPKTAGRRKKPKRGMWRTAVR